MSFSSTGITQDVIREMMPPYHLSPDLLEAMFAALPPPPPDAPAPWRQARITRLMQEISTLMPANAAQARLASQIVIVRELADTIAARAYAPELTVAQMCRVGRASAELVRTAAGVERLLARQQQKPVPFFGTVLADEVDVAAIDAAWGKRATQPKAEDPAGDEPRDLTAGTAVEGIAETAPPMTKVPGKEITNIDPIQQSAIPAPATRPLYPVPPQPSGPGVATSPEAAPALACVIAPFMRDAGSRRKLGAPA